MSVKACAVRFFSELRSACLWLDLNNVCGMQVTGWKETKQENSIKRKKEGKKTYFSTKVKKKKERELNSELSVGKPCLPPTPSQNFISQIDI